MVQTYWKQFAKAFNARKKEERVLLLCALLLVLGYGGFVLAIEPLQQQRADLARRIAVAEMQTAEESARQGEIRSSYSQDPNEQARRRLADLQTAVANANGEMERLSGRLIDPREMSTVLTRILQRETSLELISLSNRPGELLLASPAASADKASGRSSGVELYRHGLQMVVEGSYLETVRYLESLEALESNFFWERMEYQVLEYPKARITLDLYTLSTQRGWIGV